MVDRPFARLLNVGGEIIAEGACHIDQSAGTATLEASREPGDLLKERGTLSIQLESGVSYSVSDRPLVFRIWPPDRSGRDKQHRTLYRFYMVAATTSSKDPPEAAPERRPAAH